MRNLIFGTENLNGMKDLNGNVFRLHDKVILKRGRPSNQSKLREVHGFDNQKKLVTIRLEEQQYAGYQKEKPSDLEIIIRGQRA